ncbi:MAG TPA: hypothetical protein VM243_18000 [Phycisphaerae bacterium]|nr:hypothetical protein [Phycisphaerae bacterium]
MAKEGIAEDGVVLSFAEALERDGNDADVDSDVDSLDADTDDDPDEGPGAEDTVTDEADDDPKATGAKPDKKPDSDKWDRDRQARDQRRAEQYAKLEGQVGSLAEMVGDMSKTNQVLLARLVHNAPAESAKEEPAETPDDLMEAINRLDPDDAEFSEIVKFLKAIAQRTTAGGKSAEAKLRMELAAQEKRLEALDKRSSDRDARDARRDAGSQVVSHIDGLMATLFKGEKAPRTIRKEVEDRALKEAASHGYGPNETIPLRAAKLALTTAAREVRVKLDAERRGREKAKVVQDDLSGGDFAALIRQGSQTMPEAIASMGSRAL